MQTAVGIVAEFNPFHNGHRYLLSQARQKTNADVVAVVMSGNWVQRGLPAIVDKWQRTRAALDNGADLVIELPAQFAVQPADIFSYRAVDLINQLRCRWLAFGCEHPRLKFNRLAQVKLGASHGLFHNYRYTYATLIRRNFYRQTGVKITGPNDLLALNYARAKRRLSSQIQLVPIKRVVSRHGSQKLSPESRFVSSTAIRRQLLQDHDVESVKSWIPRTGLKYLNGRLMSWRTFWPLLRYRIVESSLSDLRAVYQMREGLEHRFYAAAVQSRTFLQFINQVKTKRYTYSTLLRLCFYILIHFTKADWQAAKPLSYLRILGFDRNGRKYLNQVKKQISVPLITNATRDSLIRYLRWDFKAGMLFEARLNRYEDLYQHPVIK